ncbi:hypothetical protein BKA62DRAFT_128459 [Auriculariales sp. MPI-PUGE-AT-0066]|nr:hypothetical protein BKA62DRAFT_128459 [Auriculariales sp. MPI-PUGE-AT-0066]
MAGQAVWIYFYVKTSVHPDPRRFINSKLVRWRAYVAFMYVFGGMYSCLNLSLWWSVAIDAIFKCKYREEFGTRSNLLFCLLFPLFAVWMVIYPAFGPLIILPPVQRRAFAHECDSWAAQVVLDGRSYKDPGYVANTAIFTTSQDTSPLFSFDLIQTDPSFASFHFRQFDALESAMDSTLVPVVRSITYDLVKQSFNGTCAISDGSDTPCLNGSFDLVDFALNLNYTLPGRSNVESRSRSELPGWKVYGGLPTFTLRSLGLDGMLGEPVLKTATTAAGDCTRLKVCLASSPDTNANGPVGPDTLVPLGLMLASHANYSLECTKPPKRKK